MDERKTNSGTISFIVLITIIFSSFFLTSCQKVTETSHVSQSSEITTDPPSEESPEPETEIITEDSESQETETDDLTPPPAPVPDKKVDTETHTAGQAKKESKTKTTVYYLHTSRRCGPCGYIQHTAESVVKEEFKDQVDNGRLSFKTINVEHPENRHLVEHYGLVSQSVVVSNSENGEEKEWENLDQIWPLLRNRDQFQQYIKDSINKFLKG